MRLSPGPRQALQPSKRNAWNDYGWQNLTHYRYFTAIKATYEDVTSHYFLATSPSEFPFSLKWRCMGRIFFDQLERFIASCTVNLHSCWQSMLPTDHTDLHQPIACPRVHNPWVGNGNTLWQPESSQVSWIDNQQGCRRVPYSKVKNHATESTMN